MFDISHKKAFVCDLDGAVEHAELPAIVVETFDQVDR